MKHIIATAAHQQPAFNEMAANGGGNSANSSATNYLANFFVQGIDVEQIVGEPGVRVPFEEWFLQAEFHVYYPEGIGVSPFGGAIRPTLMVSTLPSPSKSPVSVGCSRSARKTAL